MNSIEVSKLFPTGTVIVAYKGKSLGGAKVMPQWEIEALISENSNLQSTDGVLAELKVENSISLEFDVFDPQCLDSSHDFDDLAGELTFLPLDPENKVAYYFPMAELQEKSELKDKHNFYCKFRILCDDNDVFVQKIKANS